jgi:hypothetical protein
MRNLTLLLSDKLQKCWLCRHTFMANSPLVAIEDGVTHTGCTVRHPERDLTCNRTMLQLRAWRYERPQTKSSMLLWLPCLYYWLLLRSDIVQNVPCTAVIFWSIVRSHLKSNLSWFIHQSSLLAAETHSSEAGSCREMFLNLADEISLSYSAGIFNMP